MSTDLEIRQSLPEIRLPAIKVRTSQSSEVTSDSATIINQIEKSDSEDECQTPTSPEHKIPATLRCPPAPKKPRRVVSCKRKLSEHQFFEIVAPEEIESFFSTSFGLVVDVNASIVSKRRWLICILFDIYGDC
ncbi:hypothetical protein F0562_032001 [Nyssa sinensis]|uniref:Uncharacterized protein n=1 Tax=Nyssa sinensis TaxID=561372 RepID=A0A5J5AVV7_9ASTE|nr:hypothetical protein F0562_031997 [Nyssa sinensis]KAA8534484.1 hypothetical protein F0562_032001 [Nyssa sinensis]